MHQHMGLILVKSTECYLHCVNLRDIYTNSIINGAFLKHKIYIKDIFLTHKIYIVSYDHNLFT